MFDFWYIFRKFVVRVSLLSHTQTTHTRATHAHIHWSPGALVLGLTHTLTTHTRIHSHSGSLTPGSLIL